MPMDDPTGGVSQANPESIARSLVGDDLVNKYGHAFGVRPTTPADVMRDMYLGATVGPENVQKLHAAAQKQYVDQRFEAARLGMEQRRADQEKVKFVLDALQKVRDPKVVPIGYRAQAFNSMMKGVGIEPDPVLVKMLTDADKGLSGKAVKDVIGEMGNMPFDKVSLNLSDINAGLDMIGDTAKISAQRTATANAVIGQDLSQARINQIRNQPTPQTLEDRASERYLERLRTQEIYDPEASADAMKRVTRLRSNDEIDQIMQRDKPGWYARHHDTGGMSTPADAPASDSILGIPAADAAPAAAPVLGMSDAQAATPPVQAGIPNQRGVVYQAPGVTVRKK